MPYGSRETEDELVALLYGSVPQIWGREDISDENLERVKRIAALHERVGLLEMTDHEFLDGTFRRQRTTFADGATVTVDLDAGTFDIQPALQE